MVRLSMWAERNDTKTMKKKLRTKNPHKYLTKENKNVVTKHPWFFSPMYFTLPVLLCSPLFCYINTILHTYFTLISPLLSTPQFRRLRDKLELWGVDHHVLKWFLDNPTGRPQYVRTEDCVWQAGLQYGPWNVLPPLLFTALHFRLPMLPP